jgi:hypothetical protein
MTQELVFGALLMGLIGLVWVIMLSVLWSDRPLRDDGHADEQAQQDEAAHDRASSQERRAVA